MLKILNIFKEDEANTRLFQVRVPIRRSNECGYNVPADSVLDICAGQNTTVIKDSCHGDDGGPLLIKPNQNSGWAVIGLVSRGKLE